MRPRLSFIIIFLIFVGVALPSSAQTVPANTAVMIQLDQSISSQKAKRNQRVKACVAQDVVVNGDVLIPKGAPAAVFVSKVQPGGDSSKPAALVLRLDAVTVGGRAYPISADYVGEPPEPAPNDTADAGAAGATETPVKAKATDRRTAASGGTAAGNANGNSSPQGIGDVYYPSDTVLTFRLKTPIDVK